jgi:hypothetical protein
MIRVGQFPGSVELPGTEKISLAIGGFVKAVAIADSDAEAAGAAFLPAFLQTGREDVRGSFSIDSTLSRLFFDARSPVTFGNLRGYLEFDLNDGNSGSLNYKVRHAYGSWTSQRGTLTAGHTWSTFMDLKILPNGLTEPTVSGAIFQQQPLVRWSQPINDRLRFDLALEDPKGSDILRDEPSFVARVLVPDLIGAVETSWDGGHIRLGGIFRDLKVDTGGEVEASDIGWGLALSGHQRALERDRVYYMITYGRGLGRYLLGLQITDAGAIDPTTLELALRENYGFIVGYQHYWNSYLNSSITGGRAKTESLSFEPNNLFRGSSYFMANLMWQVLPNLSFGAEYSYGRRHNAEGPDADNHRIAIGTQIY